MLVSLTTLTPTMQEALRRLIADITEHDGVSPINESGSLCIEGEREADFFFMGRRSDPHGFVVCDARDQTLMGGVHPDHRAEGMAEELLGEALAAHPDYSVWAFGTRPGTAAVAKRLGLTPVRALLRMERSLGAVDEPVLPDGYEVSTYTPEDAEAIVAVNAAAFDRHPEQGKLTVREFVQLTEQPWFDPAGLILVKKAGVLAGFHWTKRHGDALGEVYVIAVAPGHEGRGLGRYLLAEGLRHLADQGDQRVQLYVEESEERVVAMYRAAGFDVVQTDTSYRSQR